MKSKDNKNNNSTTPAKKGRNPAASYTGANKVFVKHDALQAGDKCPTLCGGKVYPFKPQDKIHISGGAIAGAVLYQLEGLRCNLCGQLFTAKLPHGVCNDKYHGSFIANLAIQRYLLGTPFCQIACLQQYLGIPLPDST